MPCGVVWCAAMLAVIVHAAIRVWCVAAVSTLLFNASIDLYPVMLQRDIRAKLADRFGVTDV